MAQEQKTFNLNVTQEDLQIIGIGLEALPFKQSAPIIQKLNQQIQSQLKPVPLSTLKPEIKNNEGIITESQQGNNEIKK